jgi:hypothetical protein
MTTAKEKMAPSCLTCLWERLRVQIYWDAYREANKAPDGTYEILWAPQASFKVQLPSSLKSSLLANWKHGADGVAMSPWHHQHSKTFDPGNQ